LKKLFEVCFPLFLLLLLGPRVFAAAQPPVVVDMSPVTNAINNMFSGLSGALSGLSTSISQIPQAVVDSFIAFFKNEFVNFLSPLLVLAKAFLTTNPDPQALYGLWQVIVYIISLFYLLLFLIVGLLFIFSSFDSARRATAKDWFKSTVFLVVGVNASFLFYSLFLGLGSGIANYLWVSQFEQLFSTNALSGLNFVLLLVYAGAVLIAFITFFVRYLLLLLGTVLFPIAIFFYFIPPLKTWGKMFLEILFAGVLMQIIDVIVFIGAAAVWNQFVGFQDIIGWAPIMAFCLVALINCFILWFAGVKAARVFSSEMPELVALIKAGGQAAIGALL